MRFFKSIQWRLQLWHGLLLLIVLIGFGLTAYRLECAREMRHIDEELQERLPFLVESQHPARDDPQRREFALKPKYAVFFDGGNRSGFYYVVWLRHGEPVTYSATAPHDVPMPKVGDPPARSRGALREVFLFPGPGDCVLVGRSIVGDLAGIQQLAWVLAGMGALVLLLGLAGGAWLAAYALRPVRDISSTAGKIATGDLTQRISTADSESELGQLVSVLNATFARLDAAFTEQARFTADAAHELRTPVTAMLTHIYNGLASECPNAEHRAAFEASQRAAQRMRRLIESLLELARFDAGRETLHRDECELSEIAENGIELIRSLAEARRIEIHASLSAVCCLADGERLAQVVANLLTNAVDYNQDGGEIRVATSSANGMAMLTVANTGPGISAENLPRIFERFFRADKARTSDAGHSGLGLAIAKAIALAHGGAIDVESKPGSQTIFTLKLPLGMEFKG